MTKQTSVPAVSIIVPVYRAEKYLDRCVNSLMSQTLRDIEIILVDDGSPDGSGDMCDEYAKKDSRIKVIHKKNSGAGLSRNLGLETARGKYIGFADSDDYAAENMFETLYGAAEKYGAELVMSGFAVVGGNIFEKDGEYSENLYFEKDTLFETKENIKDLILGISGSLPHETLDSRYGTGIWKNLYRRGVIEKYGIKFMSEREIMSEDTLFTVDFASHISKAVGIPGAFYRYCRNGDSVSKAYDAKRLLLFERFMSELENRLSAKIPKNEYKIYLDRLSQAYGRVLCSQEIMYGVQNKIPYRKTRANLKKICTSEIISSSLKTYPWYRLPKKQAVFAFLIKHRLYLLQKTAACMRAG